MCDSVVALPSATGGATLFAKNSARPSTERQLLERVRPRRDAQALQVTHIAIDPFDGETLACVISRPEWCWGAEHGVNEAGVAIGNHTIYTTLDPRPFPPALIGMDLVRLGLERGESAAAAVSVITTLLDRHGQGGSGRRPPRCVRDRNVRLGVCH
jgi:secernin